MHGSLSELRLFARVEFNHSGQHTTSHGNTEHKLCVGIERHCGRSSGTYGFEAGVAKYCSTFCSQNGQGHHHFVLAIKRRRRNVYSEQSSQTSGTAKLYIVSISEKPMDEILHASIVADGWILRVPLPMSAMNFQILPVSM
jgi:hypothetical protein